MFFAKQAGFLGQSVGKNPATGCFGMCLLGGIWPAVSLEMIGPSMSLGHHDTAHIVPMNTQARQQSAIAVTTAALHHHHLIHYQNFQRATGRLTTRLANFGGVYALNSDLYRLLRFCCPHP